MQAMNVIFVLGLGLAVVSAGLVGAPRPLDGDDLKEAEQQLSTALSKLATGDGPSYELVNLISVTSQVVAGTLRTFKVELSDGADKKQCTVKIWSQPWLEEKGTGTNIKVQCEGDEAELDRTW
ncbi:cystatin-like protein [Drosophila guanche]|uniref:Blast:Cystatin-like protein n=1 Tax=Drosophila guanche TaxID=7266 RepID=A0A3B0KCQ5_DROGU|nr:cystatin-like protein [Drosophila guanche]SPP82791.1 blast:Cystatin-like protein [Drosophila guanche]